MTSTNIPANPAKPSTPFERAEALASWAEAQAAVVPRIAEDPRGSNDGPPMRLYSLQGEQPLAWCARFVRTGLLLVGALPGFRPFDLYQMASASAMYRHLVGVRNAIPVAEAQAKRGDLRFYTAPGDGANPETIHHVGIIVGVDLAERQFDVVDGNWSDAVERRMAPWDGVAERNALHLRLGPLDDEVTP